MRMTHLTLRLGAAAAAALTAGAAFAQDALQGLEVVGKPVDAEPTEGSRSMGSRRTRRTC